MFIKFFLVNIQHSYVLCEDKSTQMSVPQADKCFQINSYECAGLIDQEDMKLNSRSRMFIMLLRSIMYSFNLLIHWC